MTTPANDEPKKNDTSTNSSVVNTPNAGANDAPKKRKRKRKVKKSATTSTTTTSSPTATNNTPHAHKKDVPHKKDSETKEHTPKESPAEEKEKEKKAEAAKPNLDIKSDTHMLPGIENIHDYIARKKAPPSHKSTKTEGVDSYTTPDGTDLLKLPGLYALVPHAKGDHKLVYTTENEPAGLLDDPRKREKGAMYVKNGRDIYMVTLTMKEHPTLKDAHNESYDVWIIDTPQQLTDQLDAIKAGMGGGENFGAVIYPETKVSIEGDRQEPMDGKEESTQEKVQEMVSEETHEKDNLKPVETDIEDLTQQAETEGIDSIQLDLPADDNFPEPDIDSTLTDQDDAREYTEKEAVDTSSEAEIISLDGVEEQETNGEIETVTEISMQETSEAENQNNDEQEEMDNSVSLDLHTTEDEPPIQDESSPDPIISDGKEDVPHEGVSLDLHAGEEELSEEQIAEDDDAGHMHFNTPEAVKQEGPSPDVEASPEEIGEETSGRSLFGSAEEASRNPESNDTLENTSEDETGGMFRQPPSTKTEEVAAESEAHAEEPAEIVDQPSTPDSPLFPGAHQETNTEAYSEPKVVAEQSQETTGPVDVSALNLDDLTISEEQSHDNEPAPSSDQGSIDLDNVSPPDLEQATPQHTSTLGASPSVTTTTKKGTFPFHIIIRIVLFIIIVGALILVWKIMFPKINATKPVDTNTEVTTGTLVDDTPNTGEQDDDTLIPAEDDDQLSGTITPPEEEIPFPDPTQGLTLNELTEKLKLQQTEARKVLNIAKLLENKQAIKFSLAAMLKAGNVLERIDTETTITAEDVLKESEKIDAYLMEASKLVE